MDCEEFRNLFGFILSQKHKLQNVLQFILKFVLIHERSVVVRNISNIVNCAVDLICKLVSNRVQAF
jgi:hypothetical protein